MLDPVKEDTFQRGTAQHTIAPIRPRTPRATQTIWTPTDPILRKDKTGRKIKFYNCDCYFSAIWVKLILFLWFGFGGGLVESFPLIQDVLYMCVQVCFLFFSPVHIAECTRRQTTRSLQQAFTGLCSLGLHFKTSSCLDRPRPSGSPPRTVWATPSHLLTSKICLVFFYLRVTH